MEAIAYRIASAQTHQQMQMLERFETILNKVAEGSQAQLFSATILHGNDSIGLKGAIPDMQQRLGILEKNDQDDRETANERYATSIARLDQLEDGRHKFKRWTTAFFRWMIHAEDKATPDWKRIIGFATAIGTGASFVYTHLPTWTTMKLYVAKLALILGK